MKSTNGSIDYRNAVLAAPIHTSHISLPESLTVQVPERPHESIVTTVVSTNASHLDPTYFGLRSTATTPRTILTTLRKDGEEPEFLSLKYHSIIRANGGDEYVVKIVSEEKLPHETLERLFGPDSVKWVHTHEVCLPRLSSKSARTDNPGHSGKPLFLRRRPLSRLSSSIRASTTSTPLTP